MKCVCSLNCFHAGHLRRRAAFKSQVGALDDPPTDALGENAISALDINQLGRSEANLRTRLMTHDFKISAIPWGLTKKKTIKSPELVAHFNKEKG